MQSQVKRSQRSPRRRREQQPDTSFFKRVYTAFCQLSEPAQTMLIVGLLLLLAWLIAHPLLLADLFKVVLGLVTTWVTLKQL